ncbi:hypothetical protein VB636_00975, partial [Paracoccus sp. APAP_BH8]
AGGSGGRHFIPSLHHLPSFDAPSSLAAILSVPLYRAKVANGAGNYAAFIHRYYRFRRWGTQPAPPSGSLGYGLPAASRTRKTGKPMSQTVILSTCRVARGC